MTNGEKHKTDSMKNIKRFELTLTFDIKDTLDGKVYPVDAVHNHPRDLCDLLNEINDRADRNAELVDMEKIDLMYQIDVCRNYIEEFEKIMRKYEIDSIVKLDLMLMEQKVW